VLTSHLYMFVTNHLVTTSYSNFYNYCIVAYCTTSLTLFFLSHYRLIWTLNLMYSKLIECRMSLYCRRYVLWKLARRNYDPARGSRSKVETTIDNLPGQVMAKWAIDEVDDGIGNRRRYWQQREQAQLPNKCGIQHVYYKRPMTVMVSWANTLIVQERIKCQE
jgi:hypothetical protein